MSVVTKTLAQSRWDEGYSFVFLANQTIASGTTKDIIVDVGSDKDFVLSSLMLKIFDTENISWQTFPSTTYTEGSGSEILAIPRNQGKPKAISTKVICSPTDIVPGTPMNPLPRVIQAQSFVGNRYYMKTNVLGDEYGNNLFKLLKSGVYLLQLKNTGSFEATVELTFDGWMQ